MADNRTPKRLQQNREFRPIGDSIGYHTYYIVSFQNAHAHINQTEKLFPEINMK